MDLINKDILVIGMARSGLSAAKLCSSLGNKVVIYDKNDREKLIDKVNELESKGIKCICNENPINIIDTFDLIVLSPGVPTDLDFIQKAYKLKIPVWSEVELAYRFCKSPIIGITGTNGKTTTTTLVGQIVQSYKKNSKVVGNIGYPFTEKVLDTKADSYVIAELSSFQLETIDRFRCEVSAILNITPDHLNRHKTFENYVNCKANIFKNSQEDEFCILNYDDKECRKLAKKVPCKVVYFSSSNVLDNGAYIEKEELILKTKDNKTNICNIKDLKILGSHNVENALAAILICYYSGIPLDIIKEEIVKFQGVEHRTEFITEIDGVKYYNDSKATNPDAAIKGLNAMEWNTVLIAGGMDKGNDFTEWINAFGEKVKALIVFGETADLICETAKKNKNLFVTKVNNLNEAVKVAKDIASYGDCVLLSPACASWDMFTSFEERGDLFRELVLQLKG